MRVQSLKSEVQLAFRFFTAVLMTFPVAAATENESTDAFPKLFPPYSEIPPTFWEQHGAATLILSFIGAMLLGLAVWLWLRPKPKVALPPSVQARNELETLRLRSEDGSLLSEVSRIIRRYFSNAFQLSPGELTTAEFCRALAVTPSVDAELAGSVSEFLHRCDEQKFSPGNSALPLNAVQQALTFVETAEARRIQTPSPASSPA